ncbi:hypothetical protein PCANC_00003 [Puccinia coronata f. sp. avenae]|uniref:Uncharacterized protein n=1 Tax=Puccinia coronata f. sp. avenae TaxID=200324 RepID=A0A2N5W8F0_9BASI|nr:hypothetical protein PCANC_00003 [Puccinia coronata f. sp. avenae]
MESAELKREEKYSELVHVTQRTVDSGRVRRSHGQLWGANRPISASGRLSSLEVFLKFSRARPGKHESNTSPSFTGGRASKHVITVTSPSFTGEVRGKRTFQRR